MSVSTNTTIIYSGVAVIIVTVSCKAGPHLGRQCHMCIQCDHMSVLVLHSTVTLILLHTCRSTNEMSPECFLSSYIFIICSKWHINESVVQGSVMCQMMSSQRPLSLSSRS
jgi:hypothetical protein